MYKKKNIIWISWEYHRRTKELCGFLGVKPIIFHNYKSPIYRYIYNSYKTWETIKKSRPDIFIVQNPSIVLALLSCILKYYYNYYLVIDAHNIAIIPENKHVKKIYFLYIFMQKRADMTIVTNKGLYDIVLENGGTPFILPDRIPNRPDVEGKKLPGKFNFAYICTYKSDEPFREFINAAKKIGENINFYITGNSKNCPQDIKESLPKNIILTGYLEDNQYWQLLMSVDMIIDLTYRENCLVCGAYEAVAVEKPIMLSHTKALMDYFKKGTVFTKNDEYSILKSLKCAILNINYLNEEVKTLKKNLIRKWDVDGEIFKNILGRAGQ